MNHRHLFLSAAAMMALCAPMGAAAQTDWPQKPVHIVVAWPAGGGHDIAARMLGQELATILDVAVVVDNVTGAGGATGVRALESAAADGYTIGLIGMHAVSGSFMNANATKLDQLQPLAYISDEPGALQITADSGITTLQDYVTAMQADPMAFINGNDPQGGNSFVFANAISATLDIEMMQVPYMGHAPNVTGLVTGEVQTSTLPIPPVLEHARAGTVNVLAVASPERHFLLPDVPTFTELGYDLVVNDFLIAAAPLGVPADVQDKLSAALLDAIQATGFTEGASRNGMVIRAGGADMAAAELARQVDVVYPLLEAAGLVAPELARN